MAGQTPAESALEVVTTSIDTLFDWAPVMMHTIGKDGKLVVINRRWAQTLGYAENEALGRKSTEFLTEESRARALKETLPLFWRVGSARSVGYQWVRKDGRTLDLCMDAELVRGVAGEPMTLAALYGSDDGADWELASSTIDALTKLSRLRSTIAAVVPDRESMVTDIGRHPVGPSLGEIMDDVLNRDALATLLEIGSDISSNLRGLAGVQEEWAGSSAEQQRETMLLLKSIDGTLRDLADSIAELAQPPEKDGLRNS